MELLTTLLSSQPKGWFWILCIGTVFILFVSGIISKSKEKKNPGVIHNPDLNEGMEEGTAEFIENPDSPNQAA